MLGTVLIVVLIRVLIGALPAWPQSPRWGSDTKRRAGLDRGNLTHSAMIAPGLRP